jgi:hypothetical protein
MKAHPKTLRLCAILKDRRAYSYLVALWDFAEKFAQDGNLARFSDGEIEAACDWPGPDGGLITALVACRWLDGDGPYRVHDWDDWGGAFFVQRERDAAAKRAKRREVRATIENVSDGRRVDGGSSPPAVRVDGGIRRGEERRGEEIRGSTDRDFAAWWEAYPKKVGRGDAEKAWKQTAKSRPPLDVMLAALAWQKTSRDWTKDGGEYIKHPGPYLRAKKWADEKQRPTGPVYRDLTHAG